MNQTTFHSLSSVTKRIGELLRPAIGITFWVKAEISTGRERGGTFYCNLVETDKSGKIIAKMSCTIWSRDLINIRRKFRENDLDLKLDNGTSVGFLCSVQFSNQYGLSLKVTDADPAFALGELELKKREIINRLEKEGLFTPNKEKFVPVLPQRIGLITSKGSAAYNDFIKTLNSSPFSFQLFLADSTMQGNLTESQILKALEVLEKLDIELVVIIRGGGSKTDLFSLDNELIARKIAAYKIPVWTGIGHEIDTSVLDYVSNRYFKTPTAVAEELVARFIEMKRHLDEALNRFQSTWSYRTEMERNYIQKSGTGIKQGTRKLLDMTTGNLRLAINDLSNKVKDRLSTEKIGLSVKLKSIMTTPINSINGLKERIEDKKNRLITNCRRNISDGLKLLQNLVSRFKPIRFIQRINTEQQKIKTKMFTLNAFDPKTNLKRGYSLVYTEDGNLVKSTKDVNKGKKINTKISDGQINSTINFIEAD